jgi:hypothetical protein
MKPGIFRSPPHGCSSRSDIRSPRAPRRHYGRAATTARDGTREAAFRDSTKSASGSASDCRNGRRWAAARSGENRCLPRNGPGGWRLGGDRWLGASAGALCDRPAAQAVSP